MTDVKFNVKLEVAVGAPGNVSSCAERKYFNDRSSSGPTLKIEGTLKYAFSESSMSVPALMVSCIPGSSFMPSVF